MCTKSEAYPVAGRALAEALQAASSVSFKPKTWYSAPYRAHLVEAKVLDLRKYFLR